MQANSAREMSNAVSDGTHWATPRVCQSRATVVRVSVCLPGMSVKMTTSNVVSEKMMSFIRLEIAPVKLATWILRFSHLTYPLRDRYTGYTRRAF